MYADEYVRIHVAIYNTIMSVACLSSREIWANSVCALYTSHAQASIWRNYILFRDKSERRSRAVRPFRKERKYTYMATNGIYATYKLGLE